MTVAHCLPTRMASPSSASVNVTTDDALRIRVVQCDDESHDLGWALASECTHWSAVCPRAKKAKKANHKLKYVDSPGYLVQVNGITASTDGLPAWVEGSLPEPDPGVLEPIIKQ